MSEKQIERLNYFNGQRLEADDLRLEQDYHIQIQRWLMKTLFRPGVAKGFDVHILAGGKKILLDPGLALDDLGRAIILVAPTELTPQARFLCIRYAERKERQQDGNCVVRVNGGSTTAASWGGPERILSQPDIFWRADPPARDTRELIIAELELDANCTVKRVAAGPRLHASPLPVQQVRQLSFEGEKDIDQNNPKVISFFIRGRAPNAVTLYLRSRKFSSLHYSEMGQVTPAITGDGPSGAIQTEAPSDVDAHAHDGSTLTAVSDTHSHDVMSRVFLPNTNTGGPDKGIFIVRGGTCYDPGQIAPPLTFGSIPHDPVSLASIDEPHLGFSVSDESHQHTISGETGAVPQHAAPLHKHLIKVNVSTTGSGGETTVRGGQQLSFFTDLTIAVGKGALGVDCTSKILDRIKQTYPSAWPMAASFDGRVNKPLHDFGTGPIRLDLIDGLSFEPDDFTPYEITISVPQTDPHTDEGGCIQYNLYVE
jgi:hypothetical protein